jgi:hypothetical protein
MRDNWGMVGRGGRRAWPVVLALAAAGAVMAATPAPVPLAQALKASSSAPPALDRKTDALIAAGDASGLARQLLTLKADPGLQTAARERLLRRTLLALANLEPDPGGRRAVAAFTNFPSATIVLSKEHGHPEPRPLFDVASAARHAQRRWAEKDAAAAATAGLVAGTTTLLDDYLDGDDAVRQGIIEAFAGAGPGVLVAQRPALLEALRRGDDVGRLALEAARTLGDDDLYAAVVSRADEQTAVAAVRRLGSGPPDVDSTALLLAATARPATASAALLALGARAATDPAAGAALFDRLGGDGGASAAAALARTGDAAVVERLAALLFSDANERTRRHALLGLRLAGGGRAAAHLRRFAGSPSTPAALREEVPSWLRD